jgi:hypothetical protein
MKLVLFVLVALSVVNPAHAILTTVPPDNALTGPGAYTGVVQLTGADRSGFCSGALLWSGQHVLTAGHCPGFAGNLARFETPEGETFVEIEDRFGFPGGFSVDISISKLREPAPISASRYDIYRQSDERGLQFDKAGYGQFGAGDGTFPPGTPGRRSGLNRFDLTLADFLTAPNLTSAAQPGLLTLFGEFPGFDPEGVLLFDFDNGLAENDAAGFHFGLNDLGFGDLEINTAGGDSGSPAFINGQIAAVTSDGFTPTGLFVGGESSDFRRFEFLTEQDIIDTFNSFNVDGLAVLSQAQERLQNRGVSPTIDALNNILSLDFGFGEFSTEIRVSRYADWIDSIVGPRAVPEPPAVGIFAVALAGLLARRRGRRRFARQYV